jgi:hypothetical protein
MLLQEKKTLSCVSVGVPQGKNLTYDLENQ